MDDLKKTPHTRIILSILFLLFFIPVLAAWLVYHNKPTLLEEKTNHGELIQPPFKFSLMAINRDPSKSPFVHKKWLLVYYSPQGCAMSCQQGLYNIRQIRVAMGKDRMRVQNVLLTLNASEDHTLLNFVTIDYPDVELWHVSRDRYQTILKQKKSTINLLKNKYFIVDPQDNVVLAYEGHIDPTGILNDLEHLLKVSQIG